jgi:hypothetical protein
VLEVNNYFVSGLVVSSIDKWFMGPVPRFTPRAMDVPGDDDSLATVMEQAHRALKDPLQLAWQLVSALYVMKGDSTGQWSFQQERETERSRTPGPKFGCVDSRIGNEMSKDISAGGRCGDAVC